MSRKYANISTFDDSAVNIVLNHAQAQLNRKISLFGRYYDELGEGARITSDLFINRDPDKLFLSKNVSVKNLAEGLATVKFVKVVGQIDTPVFQTIIPSGATLIIDEPILHNYIEFSTAPPVSLYDPDYEAVYDSFVNKPSDEIALIQNQFVIDLKAGGVWDKFDFLYVYAAHTNSGDEALVNWKNPGTFNGLLVNAPVFTAYTGFQGNPAASAYIRTFFSPLSDTIHSTVNTAHLSLYSWSSGLAIGEEWEMGVKDGNDHIRLRTRNDQFGSTCNMFLNQFDDSLIKPSSDGSGFWCGIRTNSTDMDLLRNDVTVGVKIFSDVSAMPDDEIYVLCSNNDGSPAEFSDKELGIASYGGVFTYPEMTAYFNAVQTLLTAYGHTL